MSTDTERVASMENHPEEGGADNMASGATAVANRKKSSVTSFQKLATSTGKSSTNSTSRLSQHTQHQTVDADSGGEEENYNSDSELSDDTERQFLTKGAFLLTPSNELTLDKAGTICDKMNFRGPFSLTKTATGILFKFAEPDDCIAVYKKGFHKVTGARFYKKITIPCRPMRTFMVYALDVPEAVPVEDIRHALFKFQSVVEVSRVVSGIPGGTQIPGITSGVPGSTLAITGAPSALDKSLSVVTSSPVSMLPVSSTAAATNNAVAGYCPLVRITLGSQEEANTLLQNGLDFYGATFFPTEAARPVKKSGAGAGGPGAGGGKGGTVPGDSGNSYMGARIRELLPVFDATGFSKIPAPAERTVKPRS